MRIKTQGEIVSLFWSKTIKNGDNDCWPWIGGKRSGKFRYGRIKHRYKTILAHRFSFEINVRKLLPGEAACHKCDNPECVNPNHLFAGTKSQNTLDCVAKKRNPKGEKLGMSKLRNHQIIEIRKEYERGVTRQVELAQKYGICQTAISSIILRKTWKHI